MHIKQENVVAIANASFSENSEACDGEPINLIT